jgi:hypothetical protein
MTAPDPQLLQWEDHCSWVMDAAGFTPAEQAACRAAFSAPIRDVTREGWLLLERYYTTEAQECPGELTGVFLDGARSKAAA